MKIPALAALTLLASACSINVQDDSDEHFESCHVSCSGERVSASCHPSALPVCTCEPNPRAQCAAPPSRNNK